MRRSPGSDCRSLAKAQFRAISKSKRNKEPVVPVYRRAARSGYYAGFGQFSAGVTIFPITSHSYVIGSQPASQPHFSTRKRREVTLLRSCSFRLYCRFRWFLAVRHSQPGCRLPVGYFEYVHRAAPTAKQAVRFRPRPCVMPVSLGKSVCESARVKNAATAGE